MVKLVGVLVGLGLVGCAEPDARREVSEVQSALTTTFGKTTPGTAQTTATPDYKRVTAFTLSDANATVTKLTAYLDGMGAGSGNQTVRGVIYASDGGSGAPGTLLCYTETLTINAQTAAAWKDMNISGGCLIAATGTYYLGLHTGPASGVITIFGDTVSSALRHNSDTFSDGASSPFGSASSGNTQLSIYATYNTGMAGWWKLDETSGTTAADASGNGTPGTLTNGPTWVAGNFGNAVQFDGSNDYINVGNPSALNFSTGSYSYMLWVYATASVGAYDTPWWKGGNANQYPGYDMELGSGAWNGCVNDGTQNVCAAFASSPTLNAWVHLAVVVDRSAGQLKVYKNGAYVTQTSLSGFGSVASSNSARIGTGRAGTEPFQGKIDDVRVYSYALTGTEVSNVYNGGCTPTTCAVQGKNCGTISDGCGGNLNCGTCTSPETCGGTGTPNVCGCTPTTCAAQGKNCGTISDGCGGNLDCGTCTSPETCGGGGTANVCGGGVIGWWKIDEGSGTTTADSSGNGNSGTLNGPTWTTGKSGNALQFDGINDYVNLGNPSALNFSTGSFSYMLWVNVTQTAANYDTPWFKGGNANQNPGYDMELGAGAWNGCVNDSTTNLCAQLSSSPMLNAWVHLAVVVDRAAGQLKAYTNGAFANQVSLSSFGSVASSISARIGTGNAGQEPFKGKIDDVRVYNYALTGTEISTIYNGSCVPTTCAAQGKNCGSIPDGCNGPDLNCGTCTSPQTCGGSGTPNVCGTPPSFNASAVAPALGPVGTAVTVTGSGFQSGDVVEISSGGSPTSLTTLTLSATKIVAELPSVSTGAKVVRVRRGSTTVPVNGLPFTVISGHVYYVATTGSDSNSGSKTSPWSTINHAAGLVAAGDIVYVRSGSYNQSVQLPANPVTGTAAAPITFSGYPADSVRPLLNTNYSNGGVKIYGSYVVLDQLRVTNTAMASGAFAIWIAGNEWEGLPPGAEAHHITISNCEVYGADATGIHVSGVQNLFVGNEIHHNGDPAHLAHDHGIYLENGPNTVRANVVHDNCIYGIQLYREESGIRGGNTVEDNYVYHNGYGAAAGADCGGMVIGSKTPANFVRNNIFCANAKYGLLLIDDSSDNQMTGNVACYNLSGGFYMKVSGNALTGSSSNRNISYNDSGFAMSTISGVTSDWNDYFNTGSLVLKWNGASYSSLSSFQSASGQGGIGQDANSQSTNPSFTNVPSTSFDPAQAMTYNFCTTFNPALCP